MKKNLTHKKLFAAAKAFCITESKINFPQLIGVTDGKAVGTFVEHRLKNYLRERFDVSPGSSASGIDLPSEDINTDIKVTSIKQPQSSCPYKSSHQKIFGLGYNLLVLVYDKEDTRESSYLRFLNCTFVDKSRTADFTTTKRIQEILKDGGNKEDILSYFADRCIPGDEITLGLLADEVLQKGVPQGYLTISNALQWRLQYQRVISLSNSVSGVINHDIAR
ncbi:MAG: restriction endonuclease [Spirochaetota bacterium]|jgi:hypothetical protein|nr:restriction endonuclease [Spirochaetota bacterium]